MTVNIQICIATTVSINTRISLRTIPSIYDVLGSTLGSSLLVPAAIRDGKLWSAEVSDGGWQNGMQNAR